MKKKLYLPVAIGLLALLFLGVGYMLSGGSQSARTLYLYSCSELLSKPDSFKVDCSTGSRISHIKWDSWSIESASGTGTLIRGNETSPVHLYLTNIRSIRSKWAYTFIYFQNSEINCDAPYCGTLRDLYKDQQISPFEFKRSEGLTPITRNIFTFDCDTTVAKPSSIMIYCADGGAYVEKISWDSWGPSSAQGSGTYTYNDCDPDCADGKTHSVYVDVSLKKLVTFKGKKYLSALHIATLDGKPLSNTEGSTFDWDLSDFARNMN